MANEYDEILEDEYTLLELYKKFIDSGDPEPDYTSHKEPGSYVVYTKATWEGLANRAFMDKDYANLGQMFTRRAPADRLICEERSLMLESYTRQDMYTLESERLRRRLDAIKVEQANYKTAIQSFEKIAKVTQ